MPRNKREPAAAPVEGEAEAGAARLRVADKKRRPVRSRRNDVDTNDQVVGQDHPRVLATTGKAALEKAHNEQVEHPRVEPVAGSVDKAHLDNLRFAEEVLTIVVHETTDVTDDPVPFVINDGRRQAFIRGKEQEVKRKYVEVLARMKKTTYTQEKFKDSQNIDTIRNIPHTVLRYPFAVVNDPNPRGRDWLKAILSEAG